MTKNTRLAITWLSTVLLAASLAACGGGTANGECTVLDPSRNSRLPKCPTSAVAGTTTTAAAPTIERSQANAAGATATVTTQHASTAQAFIKDASGNPVFGFAVIFRTTINRRACHPHPGVS